MKLSTLNSAQPAGNPPTPAATEGGGDLPTTAPISPGVASVGRRSGDAARRDVLLFIYKAASVIEAPKQEVA